MFRSQRELRSSPGTVHATANSITILSSDPDMRNPTAKRVVLFVFLLALPAGAQPPSDLPLDAASRDAAIDALISKIDAGYVVPETGDLAVQFLRKAKAEHSYEAFTNARAFAEKITSDLRTVTKDKHLALYFDPLAKPSSAAPAAQPATREHYNYGFNRLERLRGNVGYLEIRSFANLDEAKATADAWLGALADMDSIILDLRQNGGGNTPMADYVASYFLGPKPALLTTMYWRDENRTIDVMTSDTVGGRRSLDRDLFILVGPSTFSAAEDFSYSLQQLKRATLVGETTGGGAHMGRGLQRLSPIFTAFIPVGESINPITRKNWEGTGVEPDIKVPADQALTEAHMLALRKLLDRESDPAWRENLQRTLKDLAAGK